MVVTITVQDLADAATSGKWSSDITNPKECSEPSVDPRVATLPCKHTAAALVGQSAYSETAQDGGHVAMVAPAGRPAAGKIACPLFRFFRREAAEKTRGRPARSETTSTSFQRSSSMACTSSTWR